MGLDPLSMVMIAGTGLSAAGEMAAGSAASRAAGINAEIQENQADYIDTRSAAQVATVRRDFRKFQGQLRGDLAAYGASGARGTGLELAQAAARQAKLDELNVITEGANQAPAVRMGAAMTRYEGRARKRQSMLGGLGTAMQGFSRAYEMNY